MATIAELEEKIAAINDAIDTGATSVRFRDRSVNYGSLTRLKAVRYDLQKRLATARGERRRGPLLINTRKGI
ncbi:MAG: hypothetical protein AAFR84_01210 [Pseudomonadota bacterium]